MIKPIATGFEVTCNFCEVKLTTDKKIPFHVLLQLLEDSNWIRLKTRVEKSFNVYEEVCPTCQKKHTL